MKRSQVAHPNDGIAEERSLFDVVDEEDEELLEVDEQGNVTATEGPASENTTLAPTVRLQPPTLQQHLGEIQPETTQSIMFIMDRIFSLYCKKAPADTASVKVQATISGMVLSLTLRPTQVPNILFEYTGRCISLVWWM